MKQLLLIITGILLLASCEKEEAPIVLPSSNDSSHLVTVSLGSNYGKQVFVNIDNMESTIIDNSIWDLYFDSKSDGSLVYMNGGKGVLVVNSGSKVFTHIAQPELLKWRWDGANGMRDSLVLGNWQDTVTKQTRDSVYVVDRGPEVSGPERYKQMKIVSVDATAYTLQLADIDGGNVHSFTVTKDPQKAHVYFSFNNNGTYLNFEPLVNNWHLCFLRYRYVYYELNPPLLYTVTGIYINNSKVKAAVDSTLQFSNVNYTNCHNMTYNACRDAMGFDWKVYNFANGRYVTRSFVNYVIRSTSPYKYYKLRFLDFYDDNGLKGSPRFEVQGF